MTKEAVVRARVTETMKQRLQKCLEHEGMTESDFLTSEVIRFVTEIETKILTEKTGAVPHMPAPFPVYPPYFPYPGTTPIVPQSPYRGPSIGDAPWLYPSTICSTAPGTEDTFIGDPPGTVGHGSMFTSTLPNGHILLQGKTVQVVRDRIPEEKQEAKKYYYEIRHDAQNPYCPVSVENHVGTNFYGAIVSTEPLDLGEDGRLVLNQLDRYAIAGANREEMVTL